MLQKANQGPHWFGSWFDALHHTCYDYYVYTDKYDYAGSLWYKINFAKYCICRLMLFRLSYPEIYLLFTLISCTNSSITPRDIGDIMDLKYMRPQNTVLAQSISWSSRRQISSGKRLSQVRSSCDCYQGLSCELAGQNNQTCPKTPVWVVKHAWSCTPSWWGLLYILWKIDKLSIFKAHLAQLFCIKFCNHVQHFDMINSTFYWISLTFDNENVETVQMKCWNGKHKILKC